jgi:hypothetical protein
MGVVSPPDAASEASAEARLRVAALFTVDVP